MNKKIVLAAGLLTLMAGFVEASSCSSSAASCDKTSAVAVSTDEASFASKLSQDHAIAFNLMDADEQHEVISHAHKDNLTPDAAVQGFLSQHHLAVVEGALKSVD